MRLAAGETLGRAEAVELYESVGWSGYTADPEQLLRGIAGSHLVLTVRDETGRLSRLSLVASPHPVLIMGRSTGNAGDTPRNVCCAP